MDKEKTRNAQDYLFNGGAFRPKQEMKVQAVKTNGNNDNPDAVEESIDTPPVPLKPGMQKVKDLGDSASPLGKEKLAEAEANKAAKEEKAKADAEAAAEAERKAGRARWESRMKADAEKNGDFRKMEADAIRRKDPDYEKYSSDWDPDLYYANKYGKKAGDYQRLANSEGRYAGGFEDLHELSSTEEGRELLRAALKRAEADSARVADSKAKKAQDALFSGKAFKEKKD